MPPFRQFQKLHEKLRNAKCKAFCILKNVMQIVSLLTFCEVSGFLYLKTSHNAKCHAFCICINANKKKHEKSLNV